MANLKVHWTKTGPGPRAPANPLFPIGIDVDAAGGLKSCKVTLPFPAPGWGVYEVVCDECKHRATVTTAGRHDDPRSLQIACVVSSGEEKPDVPARHPIERSRTGS